MKKVKNLYFSVNRRILRSCYCSLKGVVMYCNYCKYILCYVKGVFLIVINNRMVVFFYI